MPLAKGPLAAEALRLRLDGYTFQEIADLLNRSRQRIQQLTSPPAHIRRAVTERARGKCQHCKIVLRSHGQVHHKRARGLTPDTYNELANLRLLCPSCHRLAHHADREYMAGLVRRHFAKSETQT